MFLYWISVWSFFTTLNCSECFCEPIYLFTRERVFSEKCSCSQGLSASNEMKSFNIVTYTVSIFEESITLPIIIISGWLSNLIFQIKQILLYMKVDLMCTTVNVKYVFSFFFLSLERYQIFNFDRKFSRSNGVNHDTGHSVLK